MVCQVVITEEVKVFSAQYLLLLLGQCTTVFFLNAIYSLHLP